MSRIDMPLGFGVLSQGELIGSMEEDRLLAKRAWLQLMDHLIRHDERLKAVQLPIPWLLEEDPQVHSNKSGMQQEIQHLFDLNALKQYLAEDEARADLEQVVEHFDTVTKFPRVQWMVNAVVAENPETVLDVGAAWGEIPCSLARMGVHLVAVSPFEKGTEHAKGLAEAENLSIEWVHDVFEALDFGDRAFDVVLCCEVLEHVLNDVAFLRKAASLARKALIITTPVGSVEEGFYGPRQILGKGQHIRAYSRKRLETLLATLDDFELAGDGIQVVTDAGRGLRGQGIKNFCVRLERRKDRPWVSKKAISDVQPPVSVE